MNKEKVLRGITEIGVIAVVRASSKEEALAVAEAVKAGGIFAIEVTMTVPNAIEVIKHLADSYANDEMLIGAGTVLDSETSRAVILAGAEYVVSPGLNIEMIRTCNRYQKLCMPGAMTVTEIITAMEAGADVVKVFPGSVLGPGFVKAVRGPLPQVKLIPTGGVNLDNVGEGISSGCIAVGVGGELTKGASTGDYRAMTETAKLYREKISKARYNIERQA